MSGLTSMATSDSEGWVVEIDGVVHISPTDADLLDAYLASQQNESGDLTEQAREAPDNLNNLSSEDTSTEQDCMIIEQTGRGVGRDPPELGSKPLCLITQMDFPVVPCLVLKLPEGCDIGVRLAHVWGLNSEDNLRSDLREAHNKMILTEDFATRFGSIHGGHWTLVPGPVTLNNICGATFAYSPIARRLPHYLDEFPHRKWLYRYIHLKGTSKAFYRLNVSDDVGNGAPSYSPCVFPFLDLSVESTVHPYFVIASAALKAKHALEGESDILKLSQEQHRALTICINIYESWLKQGAAGGAPVRSRVAWFP
ncbi:hypothetical protein RSAG8_10908, partial [Rhizoctonia solani AG-8 WAC10335]